MPTASLRTRARALATLFALLTPAFAAKVISPAGPDSTTVNVAARTFAPTAGTATVTASTTASTAAQFDTTPTPLPPNVASLGFESNAVAEFGDLVQLDGTTHGIDSVSVTLSSWAIRSDFPGAAAAGYTHPLTLKIFAVDRTGATPRTGALLGSATQSFLIPWRPEPDPTSTSPLRPWRASDGRLYAGLAFNLTFDLSALALSLPDEVIYSVGFNTQHYGAAPLGVHGPYDSLNFGVSDQPPTIGIDVETDSVFVNTPDAYRYADGGAAGFGLFRRDTGWTPYKPAVLFESSSRGTLTAVSSILRAPTTGTALLTTLSVANKTTNSTSSAFTEAARLVDRAVDLRFWADSRHLRVSLGATFFDLLGEALGKLTDDDPNHGALSPTALKAVTGLLDTADSLANTALADAIKAGASAKQIKRATADLAAGATAEARARYSKALEAYGNAWQDLQEDAH